MPMSDAEREEFVACYLWARAVGWEYWALWNVAAALGQDELAMVEELAYLDAVLVHSRCLIEFLIGRRRTRKSPKMDRRWKDDMDVVPRTALPGWAPPEWMVDTLEPALDRIDKEMSHITLSRLSTITTGWDLRQLHGRIRKGFEFFAGELERAGSPHAEPLRAWMGLAAQPWPIERHKRSEGRLAEMPRRIWAVPPGKNGLVAALMGPVLDADRRAAQAT